VAPPGAVAASDTSEDGLVQGEPLVFKSKFLESGITVKPGVFHPGEAEKVMLPFMEAFKVIFNGKRVLEIGTGSGLVSLYAATLGANKVVSTDINDLAVQTASANAVNLGFAGVMEARLVPSDDISAYSVIGKDEKFDVIISNPPYSLDLGAKQNDALTDTGDLGFSIIRGLEQHLSPEGFAILFYNSTFYHEVMVKFARHEGFVVRSHYPNGLTSWEAETLFNSYLEKLLETQGVDPNGFRFNRHVDEVLQNETLRKRTAHLKAEPLMPDISGSNRWRAGFMVIRHKKAK
jgi:methylase of polypeptide subunit release factors